MTAGERWVEVDRAGAAASAVWSRVVGATVVVDAAEDPDHDGASLDLESDALPVVAVVDSLEGFAWVDAAGHDWLTVLRLRLADDLADGGHVDAATRLRSLA